jgi:V/A-type H+-transporting ATPase subunit I
MRRLRALVLDEFVNNVLQALQADGNIHVVDIKKTLLRWENLPRPCVAEQEIGQWQNTLNRIERILGDLGLKKELGLLEQLFKPRERPPIEIDPEEETELVNNAEDIVATVEKEIEEKIKKFQLVRGLLWELRAAKIRIEELRSTERLYVKLGTIVNDEIPPLENELKSRIKYVSIFVSGKKRIRFVALVSLSRFSEEIEKTLGRYNFQEIPIPKELSGDPSSCLRFLDAQSRSILKKYERQILCLYDAVLAKIERLKTKEKLGKTERVFVLEGWIPEEKEEDIKALIERAAEGHATVVVSPADEPESEIPTLLRNRKIIGCFRMLTEMYGTPLYNEIDPTPFLAVFFTFFVGLMSADLAIGATIIIGGILIRYGAGSRSKNMKSLSTILLCIGASAVLFGFLMGEFMGGLVELPTLWISGADAPIDFLLIVIAIGIGHIVLGIMLGFLNNISKRSFRKIVGDQISMLLLIGSAMVFLLTGRFEFQGITIAGYVMGIAGLATLIIGKGLIGILELTRLLSNVISYVRILALNMATTWMSRTFVLLGTLLVDISLVGPVLNGAILLFSHFFIVFIAVFATFAHALRLQYVEFFGRFFMGGGTKFSPLTSERTYTVLRTKAEKTEEKEEARK